MTGAGYSATTRTCITWVMRMSAGKVLTAPNLEFVVVGVSHRRHGPERGTRVAHPADRLGCSPTPLAAIMLVQPFRPREVEELYGRRQVDRANGPVRQPGMSRSVRSSRGDMGAGRP